MSINKIDNFFEENNKIPYIYWAMNIGDFKLYKWEEEKVIEDAKVWYSIYWIESLAELNNTNKNIIVVIPALTWNARLFSSRASQWDWWANFYWKPWSVLDPNKNIIIWLDYFWWPYDSTWPYKHNLNFYPVPAEKQVEAWKKTLKLIWIKKVDILLWWSNWGGHIHTWAFDKELEPKYLIPIAWPIAPTQDAKEFFSIQVDFIKKREDVSKRLDKNLDNLKWQSKLYDELIKETKIEIKKAIKTWNSKYTIKVVRQIWFLKFLNPKYFDRFYSDKYWNKLEDFQKAKENMMAYFKNEGKKFEKRFSLSSLALLSQAIVDAERISPEDYVKKISEKINLIIISIKDDNLFESKAMQEYFKEVKKLREKRWDSWTTEIEILESWPCTIEAGHDAFLWEKPVKKINKLILKNLEND